MDGVGTVAEALLGQDTVELRLAAAVLPDGDGDDVPDAIDDCTTVANPAQGGCPGADAGAAGDARADAAAAETGDAAGSDAPARDKAIGQACTGAGQCVSGFCTDGVCCITACDAPCQSCSTGLCLPVKQASDAPQCTGAMTCNKKGDCVGA